MVNVYLDSSAIVNLYVVEDGRSLVTAATEASGKILISTFAYAEVRAALAQKWTQGDLGHDDYQGAIADFDADWPFLLYLDVTASVARHAGNLAQQHALRGFDAVHLATALSFVQLFEEVHCLAFDNRLNATAQAESLAICANQG
ncbi:MAG TPA: type II toxin-antitoxin system VapC family toxin [Oleiagrimonas sp.]|nr:type II toxin-antitoxin system VapC family toxin [Oleiagrimonas sp.]